MMPIADPSDRHPSAASVGGGAKAMPPLWQYFLRLLRKADESIAAPKGRGPRAPAAFPLQTGRFLGVREGGHDARWWTLWPAPLRGSPAVVVGEGHAPCGRESCPQTFLEQAVTRKA
jgi:hypothetical protein